jgi:hypothetical protein
LLLIQLRRERTHENRLEGPASNGLEHIRRRWEAARPGEIGPRLAAAESGEAQILCTRKELNDGQRHGSRLMRNPFHPQATPYLGIQAFCSKLLVGTAQHSGGQEMP